MDSMLGKLIRLIVTGGDEKLPTLVDLAEKIYSANGAEWFKELKRFLRKESCWVVASPAMVSTSTMPIIDGDASASVPEGWNIVEQHKCGQVEWSKERFADPKLLYLDPGQQNGKGLSGEQLRKALSGKSVMNASVLDWLLAHPKEIPESWKGKAVFFWGTIYSDKGGDLYVRCLCWSGRRWASGYSWLDYDWSGSYPALLASTLD